MVRFPTIELNDTYLNSWYASSDLKGTGPWSLMD